MELQVMMEATTETLNATLWPGHSPSPPYQRLSPVVRHEERDVLTAQQASMGYHVTDSSLLQWQEKCESPKNSPDANDQLHSNGGSRGNLSAQPSYNQSTNGLKRRFTDSNQSSGELDRKQARRDGSNGSNSSAQWSSRQVAELADHLTADLENPLSVLVPEDIANVVSYTMSDALLALPSLTVFKQEAPSPENQANNPNLNHVTQRNHNGPHQNTGNMGIAVEPDSNNNNSNISATITTNRSTAKATINHPSTSNTDNSVRNSANGERCQSTTANLHQLLYTGNEEYPSTSSTGNQVSSTQGGSETNDPNRFQYVLAAATSTATKINEETLTYLNQSQSYEIKLKKLGDLSAYRGQRLRSSIRIIFHERRLQYVERQKILEWQQSRPGQRLLEVDVPLSYGMMDLTQSSAYTNSVEFMWDPTKEVGVYIKVHCISTEFTPRQRGGERGVPLRIHVETRLPDGPRLHAASCRFKVFKLKGADRKHKQDTAKIRKKDPPEENNYQPSYECTVLSDIPLESLTPPSPESQNEGSPYTPADAISPRSFDNVGAASPASLPVVQSGALPLALVQSVQENINGASMSMTELTPSAAVLPNQSPCSDLNASTEPVALAADANKVQTSAWLCANGFQAFTTTFLSFSAADILRLSRRDLIEICGLPDGIRLFNALPKPTKLKLYFAIEGTLRWRCVQIHNLTIGELASKILSEFNLPVDRLHSIQLQGPREIHVDMTNTLVADMEEDSTYFIETIRDPSSERYKLLLKPFLR